MYRSTLLVPPPSKQSIESMSVNHDRGSLSPISTPAMSAPTHAHTTTPHLYLK